MGYSFCEEKFITSFNAKSTEEKSADSIREILGTGKKDKRR